ncbi:hypothetical protein RIVM261_085930 [Rivularia sp. IAM M-261]|nr:hypothetical protein RIVM261_085930 [Rivularia sp. IAM M-261]
MTADASFLSMTEVHILPVSSINVEAMAPNFEQAVPQASSDSHDVENDKVEPNPLTQIPQRKDEKFSSLLTGEGLGERFLVPQGFATGGQVTQLKVDNNQPIADSDTVPAMLTPGEFVINKANAQKHLNLLEHINKGGTAEDIVPKQAPESKAIQTKADETMSVKSQASAPHYSSPTLIFKKANTTNTFSDSNVDAPPQWSSVEDLLSINNESSSQSFDSYPIQKSSSYSHKAVDAETDSNKTPNDIASDVKPITKSINSPSHKSFDSKEDDEIALEALAREVYSRLRQRLEIEQERQGTSRGRIPW